MKSLAKLLLKYHCSQDKACGVRLGQYFCNKYVKGQWPELFYCEDESKCIDIITQYLQDTCHTEQLPYYGVEK